MRIVRHDADALLEGYRAFLAARNGPDKGCLYRLEVFYETLNGETRRHGSLAAPGIAASDPLAALARALKTLPPRVREGLREIALVEEYRDLSCSGEIFHRPAIVSERAEIDETLLSPRSRGNA